MELSCGRKSSRLTAAGAVNLAVIIVLCLESVCFGCSQPGGQRLKSPFVVVPNFPMDCSWNYTDVDRIPARQFCQMTEGDGAHCENPFAPPADVDDRPGKATNVDVQDVTKAIDCSPDHDEECRESSCVNIKYNIEAQTASRTKGIQLSLVSLTYGEILCKFCFNLNFSSNGIEYFAVLENNRVDKIQFSFTLLCGLRPGGRYSVSVRTMPVDNIKQNPYETKVTKFHDVPGCDNPGKENDARCENDRRARWGPKCILMKQRTDVGDYDTLEISFPLAPASFQFELYKIFIYHNDLVDSIEIKPESVSTSNQTCPDMNGTITAFATARFNTKTSYRNMIWPLQLQDGYEVHVLPMTCLNEKGDEIDCRRTQKTLIPLIENPCKGFPCGINGTCVPDGATSKCDCLPGYVEWDRTCKADPCWINEENTTICGIYGECVRHGALQPGTAATVILQSSCICQAGYNTIKDNVECKMNPCKRFNGNVTMNPCGEGVCIVQTNKVDYYCECGENHLQVNKTCIRKTIVSGNRLIVIAVSVTAAICTLLLLSVVLYCIYRQRRLPPKNYIEVNTKTPPPPPPPPVSADELQEFGSVFERVRLLPIYSDDHPLHRDVVLSFCRFLQRHCQCNVSLMEWEKSIGPTVQMWLTNQIEEADIVLLICSKGTGLKYIAKAKQEKTPMESVGVYGDMFVKALVPLEDYFNRENACDKFVVGYFDYSSENGIPVAFKHFGRYSLMKSMEELYLRIHGEAKESTHSSLGVEALRGSNYAQLETGKALHEAIKAMRELVKSDRNWYDNENKWKGSSLLTTGDSGYPCSGEQDSGAYSRSHSVDEPRAPLGFFQDTGTTSSGQGSLDFEESLRRISNTAVGSLNDPHQLMASSSLPPEFSFLGDELYHSHPWGQLDSQV
ncbi:uncharacterized protein LOC117302528 [Asterias rubens]|uniref:uncharacterized protein LOC117302528 n=1 Tax=Asterias rubens TaxID=7604 RepID=UPI001454F032|nr:uncharacterized protein LOC117302528 [Asterias rubens]